MGGCVVQIWFKPEADIRGGQGAFELIETEMPDFATFCELADADRLIGGARLITRSNAPARERIIIARRPIAFRGSAIARCQLPTWALVEEETP
ncbi:hypothetical protein IX56_03190 [Paracoccus sanguinis]|uniref:Uncharacterized protein n=2 Tax=Paracoccus sanguinis TaxID=1545044 RepID=A0A099GKK2_9RHOB|nr:hypothetical protein IX56_03190 [Paracoccus sanguinis]